MYKHLTIVALIGLFSASQVSANTTPSADFDGDGIVGFSDFLAFVEKFGSRQGDGTYQVRYDLDGNGEIGIPDFLIFVDNFGQEVNLVPIFISPSTFSVSENTEIVITVIARDDDSQDDITGYAISGGPNQNLFKIINRNQLYLKTAPDFERPAAGDNTYTVVVQVTSGRGNRTQTAEQTITITVTNVIEAPGRPSAPTVANPTLNSLTVRWTAPPNTGPDISDYDVQYRQLFSDSDFISYPHTGTAQTTTITGLKSYTHYEVRIRARNDEGTGKWSVSTTAVPRRLPPDTQAQTPWHLINVRLYSENEPKDIQSYCTTFKIQGSVPDNINLYISPFGQRINQISFYGGIQTHIDGYTDKNQPRNTFRRRNRGAIFSRWEERNVDAIRQAPGGLVRSSGHEGNFISVRNDFTWSQGTYRLCLRKSDVVEGEPLPAAYTPEDIAYSWGRYEHTWVRMEATDMSTNETTFIGALAFPGKTLSLSTRNAIFVEIYGHPSLFPVRDLPFFSLSFSHFQVDEKDLHYNDIEEVSNPFTRHTSVPAMAQTSYLKDQRVIQIDVGKYTGKTGRIFTKLLNN